MTRAAYNITRGDIEVHMFNILVHKCKDISGFWAECPELQGCYTQGQTLREIGERIYEAVDLCLEDYPDNVDDYILNFEVI